MQSCLKDKNRFWKYFIPAVLMMVVLLLFPRTFSPKEQKVIHSTEGSFSAFEKNFFQSLPAEIRESWKAEVQKKNKDEETFWKTRNIPGGVAVYAYRKAMASPSDSNWMEAGISFVRNAYREKKEENRKQSWILALQCFEKVLAIRPAHRLALMNKASVLVESGIQPMQGIGILKTLEQQDSADVELLVRLGRYSLQSGQTDKAIARFQKAFQSDSTRLDALLHLSDAYREKGDVIQSLKYLKVFARKTPHPEEKEAALEFIREMENQTMSNP